MSIYLYFPLKENEASTKQIEIFSILFKAFIKCFPLGKKWRQMGTPYRKAGSRPVNKALCCIDLKKKKTNSAEHLLLIQISGLHPLVFLQISLLFPPCFLWNTMNNSCKKKCFSLRGDFKSEINSNPIIGCYEGIGKSFPCGPWMWNMSYKSEILFPILKSVLFICVLPLLCICSLPC